MILDFQIQEDIDLKARHNFDLIKASGAKR
jgi:hypothetical protein